MRKRSGSGTGKPNLTWDWEREHQFGGLLLLCHWVKKTGVEPSQDEKNNNKALFFLSLRHFGLQIYSAFHCVNIMRLFICL